MVAALGRVEVEAGGGGDAGLVEHPAAEGDRVVGEPGDVGVEVERAVRRVDVAEAEPRQFVEQQRAGAGVVGLTASSSSVASKAASAATCDR